MERAREVSIIARLEESSLWNGANSGAIVSPSQSTIVECGHLFSCVSGSSSGLGDLYYKSIQS